MFTNKLWNESPSQQKYFGTFQLKMVLQFITKRLLYLISYYGKYFTIKSTVIDGAHIPTYGNVVQISNSHFGLTGWKHHFAFVYSWLYLTYEGWAGRQAAVNGKHAALNISNSSTSKFKPTDPHSYCLDNYSSRKKDQKYWKINAASLSFYLSLSNPPNTQQLLLNMALT